MNRTIRRFTARIGGRAAEGLMLCGLVLLAATLATPFAAEEKPGERNWLLWWHAHQLFGREPEELNERQSQEVERWWRCVAIATRCDAWGMQSLTDDECQEVVETLDDLCPYLSEHDGYLLIYDACRRRLAGKISDAG